MRLTSSELSAVLTVVHDWLAAHEHDDQPPAITPQVIAGFGRLYSSLKEEEDGTASDDVMNMWCDLVEHGRIQAWERPFSFDLPRQAFAAILDRPISEDDWATALRVIDDWWEMGDMTIHKCVGEQIIMAIDAEPTAP